MNKTLDPNRKRTSFPEKSRFREVLLHDKKAQSGDITVVLVDEIGSFSLKTETVDSIIARIKGVISFS